MLDRAITVVKPVHTGMHRDNTVVEDLGYTGITP